MARSTTGTPRRCRRSRLAALLAAPAVALCLLSGCGAGQQAQTSGMVAAVAGNEADSRPHGQAALRDVQIRYNSPEGYPAGATVPLSLYIANNSQAQPLVLRDVTAGTKNGAPLGPVVLLGGAPDIGTGPAEPSAPEEASAPAEASEGPSAAGAPAGLTIPPNGHARLATGHGAYLAITEVTQPLRPGSTAYVTFTFDGEQPLTIAVPFGIPLSPAPRPPGVPSVTAGQL